MPIKSLKFPSLGVVRRELQEETQATGPFSTPWASNVRLECPFARRLRGGSRPGLTKLLEDPIGTTIVDIVSVQTSSASGTDDTLVALVDESIGVVSGGAITYLGGYLTDESGNYIVTEAGDKITLGTADPPTSGFLVAGEEQVYAVRSSSVVRMDIKSGKTDNLLASAGTVPTGCTVGAVYRNRLALAGGDNAIYLSRQGDYADWDYGADAGDAGRAIAFQLSISGEIGDVCRALVPHEDAFLVAAAVRTLWIVRGDPATSGSLNRISNEVGIIGSHAWCKVGGSLIFLAEDGLYQVALGGSDLKSLSKDRLPEELRDIDTETVNVLMAYDHDHRAVHIYLPTSGSGETHWLFELGPQAFWPIHLSDDHTPAAVVQYQDKLVLACSDGYLRYVGGDDDDGTTIESHVLIGPLRPGGAEEFGLIQGLDGTLGTGSGTVAWRIVVGETADEAAANGRAAIEAFQAGGDYSGNVKYSGSWTAGRAFASLPRVKTNWACIWLQSTAKWAYETMTMLTSTLGRWR